MVPEGWAKRAECAERVRPAPTCRAPAGNEGLGEVIAVLEDVKAACPPLTYADLYQLAGVSACVAVSTCCFPLKGGPWSARAPLPTSTSRRG